MKQQDPKEPREWANTSDNLENDGWKETDYEPPQAILRSMYEDDEPLDDDGELEDWKGAYGEDEF